jgi:type II secretory pathway component PulF
MPNSRTQSKTAQTSPFRELSALDWIALVVVGLVISILIVMPFVMTPAFVTMYADFGGPSLPACTRLVSGPWFPVIGALASSTLVVLALLPGRAGLLRRRLMIAGAFLVGCLWVGVYLFGMYTPIFELADAVAPAPGL